MNKCFEFAENEGYLDLIVDIKGDIESTINRIKSTCIYELNEKFAIAYKKIEGNNISISSFNYSEIPKCYGLSDSYNIESIGVDKVRTIPNLELFGNGVIIGFIDTGIDYTNSLFINEDKTSRIIHMWDQTEKYNEDISDPLIKIPYGVTYNRDLINNALNSDNPYEIVKEKDEDGHGTFMASIAAGNISISDNFSGTAPLSDIAVVKLKGAKKIVKDYYVIKEDVLCYMESDIMAGIEYFIELAKVFRKPVIIYLGIGTNQGEHIGNSYLEQYIDFLSEETGICIVCAAGNEVNKAHHYKGLINVNSNNNDIFNVELKVGKDEFGFSTELWCQAPNTISIEIISPAGERIERIPARLSISREERFIFDNTVIKIEYKLIEKISGDELIILRFIRPTEGIWQINVYTNALANGEFNMWLPLSEFISNETFFINPDPYTTLCSPANSRYAITAGGYNNINDSLYIDSSRGYTLDNRIKPDFVAPCVNIRGAYMNTFSNSTGTSIAAAFAAGIAALLMEWGIVKKNDVNMNGIRLSKYLIRGTIRSNARIYPNREWGWGIINLLNTFINIGKD